MKPTPQIDRLHRERRIGCSLALVFIAAWIGFLIFWVLR